MKRFFSLAIVMFLGVFLYAQTETKNFNVSDFTGIDAGGVFNIELVKANKGSVSIEAHPDIMKYIEVSVSKGVLDLDLDTDDMPRALKRDMPKIYVKIGMNELKYLELSGASKLTCLSSFSTDNFKADMSGASKVVDLKIDCRTFFLEASGASKMNVSGKVSSAAKYDVSGATNLDIKQDVGSFKLEASGASKIKFNGSASERVDISFSGASNMVMTGGGTQTMIVSISGASKFNSLEFPAADLNIKLSGVSKADVNATGTLRTSVSGGSKLNYKGNATVTHSTPPSIRKID